MSDQTTAAYPSEDRFVRWRRIHDRVFEAIYRDRTGLLVFVLALVFVGALWRVGFVINDNETLANGVAALADGHLAITTPEYGGPNGEAPGTAYHEGRIYAREYGIVVPAAIITVVLRALRVVFDLQVLFIGIWCSLLAVAVREVSTFVDRQRLFLLAGGLLAAGLFVGNLAVATPITDDLVPILGLQIWTALAAALAATAAYRLFALEFEERKAGFLGLAVIVATPVGFWATTPKRHVIVSLATLVVAYAFVRQRSISGLRGRLYRTVPYATAAYVIWVHPGDGALLLAAVAFVDVVFGEAYDVRQLALTPIVFGIALLPFLVTNTLISGDPTQAPNYLESYSGDRPISNGSVDPGGTPSDGQPTSPNSGSNGDPVGFFQAGVRFVTGLAAPIISLAERGISYADRTVQLFVATPSRVFETFVRSGFVERASNRGADSSINLSYLESMPLAMGAFAGTIHVVREGLSQRPTFDVRELVFRDASGAGRARAFAVAYIGLMILIYQQRLPLHAMVTVRYLVPTMPLVLFLVFQAPAFREAVSEEFSTVVSAYALAALVGGEALAAVFVVSALSVGEAVQLHALIALLAAVALAVWMVAGALRDGPQSVRAGAVLIGVTFGVTTVFLVLSALLHFPYGRFLLPISGELSALLN